MNNQIRTVTFKTFDDDERRIDAIKARVGTTNVSKILRIALESDEKYHNLVATVEAQANAIYNLKAQHHADTAALVEVIGMLNEKLDALLEQQQNHMEAI